MAAGGLGRKLAAKGGGGHAFLWKSSRDPQIGFGCVFFFWGTPCLVGLKEKPTILGGPPQEGHTHFAFSTWFPFKNPKHKG